MTKAEKKNIVKVINDFLNQEIVIIGSKNYENFLHINLGSKKKYFERVLRKNQILTRKGPGVEGFEDYLRISLGSKDQMKKIILLLKKTLI